MCYLAVTTTRSIATGGPHVELGMTTPNPLQHMIDKVMSARDGLLTAQQRLVDSEFVGEAGGLVSVTVRGSGEVVAVRLDPSARKRTPAELEELFLQAAQQAQQSARTFAEQLTAPFADMATFGV